MLLTLKSALQLKKLLQSFPALQFLYNISRLPALGSSCHAMCKLLPASAAIEGYCEALELLLTSTAAPHLLAFVQSYLQVLCHMSHWPLLSCHATCLFPSAEIAIAGLFENVALLLRSAAELQLA